MKSLISLFFLAFTILITGCVTMDEYTASLDARLEPKFLVPDYAQRQPRVIVVLPIEIAETLKGLKEGRIQLVVENALEARGYKVVSSEHVIQRLKDVWKTNYEIYEMIYEKPINLLSQMLGSDAILKARLIDYNYTCTPTIRSVYSSGISMPMFEEEETYKLEMEFSLVEGITGETLWRKHLKKSGSYGPRCVWFPENLIKAYFVTLPKAK